MDPVFYFECNYSVSIQDIQVLFLADINLWSFLSFSGIVSIMTLCALAYERYIRVVHAKVVDFPWAWRAITHIWLYSLAWTGAPLLGWNRYTLEIHQLGCSLDWASRDPNDAAFVLLFLLFCFFVPVGIMVYCYGNILYTVHMVRTSFGRILILS